MFKRHPFYSRYSAPEADPAAAGGGGGDGAGDDAAAAIDAKISKAVEAATAGLKSKNGELLGKLKDASETLKRFEGIDPDAMRAIQRQFADDEDAKLIAAGKFREVLDKNTERMKADFAKQLAERDTALTAAQKRLKARELRVLDESLRTAAMKAGLHQHAIDDALFRGRTMFSLDEHDNAVQLDDDGRVVIGKDGKTPYSVTEWLESMKDAAPHWFPATASGGGASGGGNGAGGRVMTEDQFAALSPKQRAARMAEGYRVTPK